MRPRVGHCLMLRQRRWVRACAHDPAVPEAWFKHEKPHDLWGIYPRLAFELFARIAYDAHAGASRLADELQITIRKQLTSSAPRYKSLGVLTIVLTYMLGDVALFATLLFTLTITSSSGRPSCSASLGSGSPRAPPSCPPTHRLAATSSRF